MPLPRTLRRLFGLRGEPDGSTDRPDPGAGKERRRFILLDPRDYLPEDFRSLEQMPRGVLREVTGILRDFGGQGTDHRVRPNGVFEITYRAASVDAASLKHRVVREEIKRRLQELTSGYVSPGAPHHRPPRLDATTFAVACRDHHVMDDRVHILDLSGETASSKNRLRRVVEEVLDDYLSLGGHYTAVAGLKYLLIFPNLTRAGGSLKLRIIRTEITRRLAVAEDVAKAPGPVAASAGTSRRFTLPRARTATTEGTDDGDTEIQWVPFIANADKQVAMNDEAIQRQLWNQAVEAMATVGALRNDVEQLTTMPEGHDVRYASLWRPRRRFLTGQLASAVQRFGGRYEPVQPLGRPEARERPDPLDLPILVRTIEAIPGLTERRLLTALVVPVHFQTLDRLFHRTLFLETCGRLTPAQRRFLVLELVGVPDDLVPFRVEERVMQMRAVCRSVLGRVDLHRSDFQQWSRARVYALGVDMSRYPEKETKLLPAMEQFVNSVDAVGRPAYIHGIQSRSVAIAAIAAGFDYISGPAIAPLTPTPKPITPFPLDSLFPTPDAS